jgi:outer membrane lipoprotein SlyB
LKKITRNLTSAILLPSMLFLSACTTGLETRYDEPTDVCRYARLPLIQTEQAFNQSILVGAGTGAAIGAGAGALIGRDWRSALIGAAAGLVAGALSGYAKAKMDQAQTREQLQASVDADAGRDLQQMNGSIDALHQLIDCRNSQIAQVTAQFSSKSISREQALTQYQLISQQMLTDDKLIGEVLGKADERSATYVSTRAMSTQLPPENATSPPPPADNPTVALVSAQHVAAADRQKYRELRASLETRIQDINAVVG